MRRVASIIASASLSVEEHNGHTTSEGNPVHPSNNLNATFNQGSPNVFINGNAVLRKGDIGLENCTCCGGSKQAVIISGSTNVFVNGKPIAREGDIVQHHTGGDSTLHAPECNVNIGG